MPKKTYACLSKQDIVPIADPEFSGVEVFPEVSGDVQFSGSSGRGSGYKEEGTEQDMAAFFWRFRLLTCFAQCSW